MASSCSSPRVSMRAAWRATAGSAAFNASSPFRRCGR
nr:MAG TPA: hypothetical protein [Caudoviricetes sp.]